MKNLPSVACALLFFAFAPSLADASHTMVKSWPTGPGRGGNAVDDDGFMYEIRDDGVLRKTDGAGMLLASVDYGPKDHGDVEIGPDGLLYVGVDRMGIHVLDTDLNPITTFGDTGDFIRASRIVFQLDGLSLLLYDANNLEIEEWSINGTNYTYVGTFASFGSGPGVIDWVWSIEVHPITGRVYVSEHPSPTIEVFNSDGTPFMEINSGNSPIDDPRGLAFDSAGNLWVFNSPLEFAEFLLLDSGLNVLHSFLSSSGVTPFAMTIGPEGSIYDYSTAFFAFAESVVPRDLLTTPTGTTVATSFLGQSPPTPLPFEVVNEGALGVDYELWTDATWLQIDAAVPLTGSLATGDTLVVDIHLDTASFPLGSRSGHLLIKQTNPLPTSDAITTFRTIDLTVQPLPSSTISLTPGTGIVASGAQGGPFTVTQGLQYELTTSNPDPVDYAITTNGSWLSPSSPQGLTGSISSGQTVFIDIAVDQVLAETLLEGSYPDLLDVEQTWPPATPSESRSATLFVGPQPVLEVTSFLPISGLTTAMLGGDQDTLSIVGTLLEATNRVWIGGRLASVLSTSPTLDTLTVVVPPHPPGVDCVNTSFFDVAVSVASDVDSVVAAASYRYDTVEFLVPEEFSDIQSAVDASIPGVCISVAPGIYFEAVDMSPAGTPRNGITLTSRDPSDPDETTIQASGTFTPTEVGVRFSGNDFETVLQGFQIMLGNSGIVVTAGASPTIIDNFVTNNFSSGDGGAIRIEAGCSPNVIDNRFSLNSAVGNGGGVALFSPTATLQNNGIVGNTADGDGGGLYLQVGTGYTISDAFIYGNVAGGSGGGIYAGVGGNLALLNSEVVSNSGGITGGGGLHVPTAGLVTIQDSKILGNHGGSGGGAFVPGDGFVLNSEVSGNIAEGNGGGIVFATGANVNIRQSSIQDNETLGCERGGGGLYLPDFTTGTVDSCMISGNGSWNGGGIYVGRKSRVSIRRNVVAHNRAVMMLSDGETCAEDTPPPAGPGIYVFDGAPEIVNNTIDSNSGGLTGGGGIHGVGVGTFGPDWVNNIVSNNSNWGIYCVGQNAGVRIDYNLGWQNGSGSFSSTIQIPGAAPVVFNVEGDPLYVDATQTVLDYQLSSVSSAAVDIGDVAEYGLDPDSTPIDAGVFYFDQAGSGVPGSPTSGRPAFLVTSVRPIPFSEQVNIELDVYEPGLVSIDIFDSRGRRLLHREMNLAPGPVRVPWDGRDGTGAEVTSGIYYCRISAPKWSSVDRVVKVK